MKTRLTGTGLDGLIGIIETDAGIKRKISASEVDAGAQAAGELNHLIVDGIRELGLANDGRIDAADLLGLGDWVRASPARNQTYLELYGTDRNGRETGFQRVENEDSSARLFGQDAVDEVADAIYSFGFGDRNGRLLDVDGKLYRSVNLTANWLDELLTDADMKALSNPNGSAIVEGTTGTGLDRIIDFIQTDPGLIRNVSRTDIAEAAGAADALNNMYLDGMKALGLANDGTIDKSDVVALGEWLRTDASRFADFLELHEDWHLVLNKGADLAKFDGVTDGVHPHIGHVVNHGFRGIYQIGFGAEDGVLLDDDGDRDVGARVPAAWFDQLLSGADKAALSNPVIDTSGMTETGLDRLVEIINTDPGLIRNVSRSDIAEAAAAADAMNNMYLDGMKALGLANDGTIDRSDVMAIDGWIREDAGRHADFLDQHASYHLVLHKGAEIGQIDEVDDGVHSHTGHAINHGMKGVYQVGLGIEKGRLLDDSGAPHISTRIPANWFDQLLSDADMATLINPDIDTSGTTGTGLDRLVEIINTDRGLIRNVSRSEITEAAAAADGMNQMIVDAIDTLGLDNDGKISSDDVKEISTHIQESDARADRFDFLHGNNTNGVETGFHLVWGDGGTDKLFGRHAVNTVADAIYKVGFEVDNNRFFDEDGDLSYSVYRVADYIDDFYF